MTIYRRRLASSFSALRQTLQRHLDAMAAGRPGPLMGLLEDAPDDDTTDDILEADEVGTREHEALAAEEKVDIERLLAGIGRLPPDSKLGSLKRVLHELRGTGYGQVMVFTQYTDTMDFLRDASIATEQGSASAARLTHAIATTSRGSNAGASTRSPPSSRHCQLDRARATFLLKRVCLRPPSAGTRHRLPFDEGPGAQ